MLMTRKMVNVELGHVINKSNYSACLEHGLQRKCPTGLEAGMTFRALVGCSTTEL